MATRTKARIGDKATVIYISPRTHDRVVVVGILLDDRVPHMYVGLDTDKGPLRIPRKVIVEVI